MIFDDCFQKHQIRHKILELPYIWYFNTSPQATWQPLA